jgi:hypothetical protein
VVWNSSRVVQKRFWQGSAPRLHSIPNHKVTPPRPLQPSTKRSDNKQSLQSFKSCSISPVRSSVLLTTTTKSLLHLHIFNKNFHFLHRKTQEKQEKTFRIINCTLIRFLMSRVMIGEIRLTKVLDPRRGHFEFPRRFFRFKLEVSQPRMKNPRR